MITSFVRHNLHPNNWPITLVANGPSYRVDRTNFKQTERFSFLIIAEEMNDCLQEKNKLQNLIHSLLCLIFEDLSISIGNSYDCFNSCLTSL